MPSAPPFGPPLVGQTEKALNAILMQHLAGTGLTAPQWVTLSVTLRGGGTAAADELVRRVAGALKVGEAHAAERIDELAGAQLLERRDGAEPQVIVTAAGERLHGQIRNGVGRVTDRLLAGLPAEDLAAAARVLGTVLERADAELASA